MPPPAATATATTASQRPTDLSTSRPSGWAESSNETDRISTARAVSATIGASPGRIVVRRGNRNAQPEATVIETAMPK